MSLILQMGKLNQRQGASIVVQCIMPPPAVPASHTSTNLSPQKEADKGSSTWVPINHMGDQDGALGLWLLVVAVIWEAEQQVQDVLSFSNSAFQIKKQTIFLKSQNQPSKCPSE